MGRGDGRVYLQKGSRNYMMQFSLNGKPYRESTNASDEKKARDVLRKRLKEVHASEVTGRAFESAQMRKIAVSDLCDLLENHFVQCAKWSAQNRSNLKRVRTDFGDSRALAITSEQIDTHIRERLASGDRPASINRTLQMLGQAYNLAAKKRKLCSKPYIQKLSEKDNVRTGFANARAVRMVLAALPADLRDFCLFGYVCGWRKGSISSLRWTDVDLECGEINLPGQFLKNGEPLKMVIEDELEELFKRREAARAVKTDTGVVLSEFVFHRDGETGRVKEFRKTWKAATSKAGVPQLLFHDFRRTAAPDLVRSGVKETVAMRITGHKTRSVFDRYNITSADDLREAIHSVATYREAQATKVVALKKQA
jgi:integrase